MTHPYTLKRFKCEYESENNGKRRSWGMLLSSQHFRGVERCAGAPRWGL